MCSFSSPPNTGFSTARSSGDFRYAFFMKANFPQQSAGGPWPLGGGRSHAVSDVAQRGACLDVPRRVVSESSHAAAAIARRRRAAGATKGERRSRGLRRQRAEVGRRLAGGEQGAPRAAVGGELRPLGAVTRDYTLTSYITQSASVRGTSPMLSVVLMLAS